MDEPCALGASGLKDGTKGEDRRGNIKRVRGAQGGPGRVGDDGDHYGAIAFQVATSQIDSGKIVEIFAYRAVLIE